MNYLIKESIAKARKRKSYSFNREILPFPEHRTSKAKPPSHGKSTSNTKELFIEKKPDEKELFIQLMSEYKKAERIVIYNFYTGGSPYKAGMMDAIYSGMGNFAAAA